MTELSRKETETGNVGGARLVVRLDGEPQARQLPLHQLAGCFVHPIRRKGRYRWQSKPF